MSKDVAEKDDLREDFRRALNRAWKVASADAKDNSDEEKRSIRRDIVAAQLAKLGKQLQEEHHEEGRSLSISSAVLQFHKALSDIADDFISHAPKAEFSEAVSALTATELSQRVESYQRAARLRGDTVSFAEAAKRVLNHI